ncbi:hypothetical protein BJV78DRAFT_386210 [Lactifluus subvellereus]|nr:hypothetical protein BJV78DRAFT_386210 [Lactifluus subvellereus]
MLTRHPRPGRLSPTRMQKERATLLIGAGKKCLTRALNCRLFLDNSPVSYPNAGNAAVEVPTEILRVIFLLCIGDPVSTNRSQKYPPTWISITYVCRRWRAVAIGFQDLWSTITPDLSPKWTLAFLKRSSNRSLHLHFNVGSPPKQTFRTRVKLGKKRRLTAAFVSLSDKTIKKILSHTPRIQELQISGNGTDVIRILKSLDKQIPLVSLTIRVRDGYDHHSSRNDASFAIPQTFIGGSAHQLRHLHCLSGLHFTFPSWMLASISDLTVSMDFSPYRLFAVLHQMPQLGTLKVCSMRQYFHLSDHGITPVHLNSLSLLVLETNSLDLYIALSTYLLLSTSVRRHFNLNLSAASVGGSSWNGFLTSLKAITSITPSGVQGLQFKRQHNSTCIRAWAMPAESLPIGSAWPPLDDIFSLQVQCTGFGCYSLHSSIVHEVSFHYLQDLCVSLGRETAKELSVEYYGGKDAFKRFQFSHCCWRTLFSGLPKVTTLRFGDGAAHLLISASYGTVTSPMKLSRRSFPNLRKVQVARGTLRTRTLSRWIQYASAPPENMNCRELRKHVQTLLVEQWSTDTPRGGTRDSLDVTEGLLIFLLHWRSKKTCVSELALPECERDELDALKLLEQLLRMLDWEVVLGAQNAP